MPSCWFGREDGGARSSFIWKLVWSSTKKALRTQAPHTWRGPPQTRSLFRTPFGWSKRHKQTGIHKQARNGQALPGVHDGRGQVQVPRLPHALLQRRLLQGAQGGPVRASSSSSASTSGRDDIIKRPAECRRQQLFSAATFTLGAEKFSRPTGGTRSGCVAAIIP